MKKELPIFVKDVLMFIAVLLGANLLWKIFFTPFISDTPIFTITDQTPIFKSIIALLSNEVFGLLHLFKPTLELHDNVLSYGDMSGIKITWTCTAIKQFVLLACIILASRGNLKHKIYYILFSIIPIHLTNFLRIFFLTLIIENHRQCFTFCHEYLFKYIFYGVLFLLWLFWIEKNEYLCNVFRK